MSYPNDLFYTKDHEWIRFEEGNIAQIGITDYALEQLGDVVFLELPDAGSTFDASDSFGTVESTKTVSDLYCPLSGQVKVANTELTDNLETLSSDPYGKGWLIKLSFQSKDGELMSSEEYQKYISELD